MWQLTWRTVAFACFIFIVRPTYAIPTNEEVANWTKNVLANTVTVTYKELLPSAPQAWVYEKYYSGQAISGLNNFFSEVEPIIIRNKLSIHPQPIGPPKVTQQGRMNDLHYWQVSQSFHFPSLKKDVWFSVIVIENETPPLLIQSLNMEISNKN